MSDAYKTICHRDGSVTVWNVYTQGYIRTTEPSDRVLASLPTKERHRVLQHLRAAGHINEEEM